MGLLSSKKTYNTYQTGLGDTQFDTLKGNQSEIAGIADAGFATVGTGITNLGTKVDGVNTNTDSGFVDLKAVLKGYNDEANSNRTTAALDRSTNYGNIIEALKNNTGGLATQASLDSAQTALDTGFADTDARFDGLDSSIGSVQNTADNIITDVGTVQSAVDTGFSGAGARFDTLDVGQTNAAGQATANADALGTQLTNTQAEVLGGQGTIDDNLATMSNTADIYAGQSLANQDALQSGQDDFKSSFDSYVDRYGQDTTLANSARSDLASAQATQTDRLRSDIGEFAQASAVNQGNISRNIGTLGTGIDAGFETLGSAVGTGFSTSSMEDQITQENFNTRLGNVRELIQSTSDSLGVETADQYNKLVNAFDENGNLIANSIDAQGNTISRALDDQGNVIERKLDINGNEISAVSMDVETMLGNAEAYERSLMGQLDKRFDQSEEATNTELQAISRGFSQQDKKLDTQTRNLAGIAAEQTDLDMNMRNEFKQLEQSFDDQGNLIQNSVLENGTTVSRAMDDKGNLLLRSFDAQGSRVGDQVMNINRTLNNLSQLATLQGANVSMGNLSPAMSAGAPETGFASPFATTR
jgi:hypothetical protein